VNTNSYTIDEFHDYLGGVVHASNIATAYSTARESCVHPIGSPRTHLTPSPYPGNGARPRRPIPLGEPADPQWGPADRFNKAADERLRGFAKTIDPRAPGPFDLYL
jgi:hypothetical protein